jgi:HTH-type transcriptional regulator/antitoxin HigA
MEPSIIKSREQYEQYVKEVERLTREDPDAASPNGLRLELIAKLVEDYEKSQFSFRKADPIDAIVFRMEQQGLRQKDLAPLLGGPNRASEILAGKRPLTLPMIRALHEHLHIPLELLILEPKTEPEGFEELADSDIPVDELVKRGWLDAKMAVSDLLMRFEKPLGSPVLLRHTKTFGRNPRTKAAHVWLWLSRVREIGDAQTYLHGRFRREDLNEDFIRYVARLSFMEKGPRLAKEFLEEKGIAMVIEPHLPQTHLDGAALLGRNGAPIIGLTLREDRLDNFWFTLLHELVHAWKHLDASEHRAIADENIEKGSDDDIMEKEANDLARDILIPRVEWTHSDAHFNPSIESIRELAAELQISPAIVAGRVRYETQNYKLFPRMVGYKQVRRHFPEVRWN